MNKTEKIKYWLNIADYDLETAKSMFASKRWLYVVFMCQQAIEKLIKALYIDEFDEEPPRTHNLAFIYKKMRIYQDKTELQTDILKFLNILSAHYLNNRYPDYKNDIAKMLSEKTAKKYLTKTTEIYKWLKSLIV